MNNPLNNINLTIFSTTVGHAGYKDIYKYTLSDFNKYYGLNNFGELTAAIKVHNKDEDFYNQMSKDFKNFTILKEIAVNIVGENPHKNDQFYGPYIIDNLCNSIANVFTLLPIKTEFVFWNEGDRIIRFNENYQELLQKAIDLMRKDDSIFSIKLGGPNDPIDEENNLFFNSTFHHQSMLIKSEKIFNVCQLFKNNYFKLRNIHPEMMYSNLIDYLYPNSKHLRFNPKFAYHVHLGEKCFPKIVEKYNLGFE